MSESDSDLDFESADEDSEFISKLESETSTVKNSGTESKKADAEPPKHEAIPEVEKKSPSNVSEACSAPCSLTPVLTPCSAHTETPLPIPNVDTLTLEEVAESTRTSENSGWDVEDEIELDEEDIPPRNSAITGEINLMKDETFSESTTMSEEVRGSELKKEAKLPNLEMELEALEPLQEKQRVPLRLEKRKEKTQMKEIPPVVESKADYVNILHESNKEKFSSWGFSSWGTSLLSTAASSVSSFSSQVSQGIGTVLESVESTLGAPPPEELASILKERKDMASNEEDTNVAENETDSSNSILADVSSWTTKVLENTGSKVLMGGLDTLEMIGKKSMNILTVGDPGFRKTRSAFSDGVNLSEILREAKSQADHQGDVDESGNGGVIHFSQVFDDKQGLVHLEALEMLSRQSQGKLQRLLLRHSRNQLVKRRLEEIKAICEDIPTMDDPADYESYEDFESVFKKYAQELDFTKLFESVVVVHHQINETLCKCELNDNDSYSSKEIFEWAISNLAEFTAKCIEVFHKVAELILVQPYLDSDIEKCATNLTGLTTVMCIETNNISLRYHKCLDRILENSLEKSKPGNDITAMVTNLYVEASNSNKYIQDAYLMLIPVLQERLLEIIE